MGKGLKITLGVFALLVVSAIVFLVVRKQKLKKRRNDLYKEGWICDGCQDGKFKCVRENDPQALMVPCGLFNF
jgi:hypothetical protein